MSNKEALFERGISRGDIEGAIAAQREIGQQFVNRFAEVGRDPEKLRKYFKALVSELKRGDGEWDLVQKRVVAALLCAGMSEDELSITSLGVSRVVDSEEKRGDNDAAEKARSVGSLLFFIEGEVFGMDLS